MGAEDFPRQFIQLSTADGPYAEARHVIIEHAQSQPDPILKGFAGGIDLGLDQIALYRNIFMTAVARRSTLSPVQIWHEGWRSLQIAELRHDEDHYLENLDTYAEPEIVLGAINRIVSDRRSRVQLYHDLVWGLLTNKAQRFPLVKLAAQLHGISEARIRDKGCSQNHGLKSLALHHEPEFAYQPVEAIMLDDGRAVTDVDMTERLNNLIACPDFQLVLGVGEDLLNPDDPLVRSHARADSFYPWELKDGSELANFDRMSDQKPPNVKFQQGNIAEAPQKKDIAGYNIIVFSFSLSQLSNEERQAALRYAEIQAGSGIVCILESGQLDSSGQFEYHDPMKADSAGFWVKDMRQPDLGYRKYFTPRSGRVKQIQIEPVVAELPEAAKLGVRPTALDRRAVPRDISDWRSDITS